jgi:hypothetical protein
MTRTSMPPTGRAETRFADTAPKSFDKASRTVDAVISTGSAVQRIYGVEKLRISPDAVGLDRMKNGSMIPVLDSHQAGSISNALGRVTSTWFARGALWGKLAFNETPMGTMAMGMVQRGEIAGISAGYAVREWEITDKDGRVIDPEVERIRWDEDGLTFTATSWDLHECSLVNIPADMLSGVRSMGSGVDRASFIGGAVTGIANIRARMFSRQRMAERQSAAIGKDHE